MSQYRQLRGTSNASRSLSRGRYATYEQLLLNQQSTSFEVSIHSENTKYPHRYQLTDNDLLHASTTTTTAHTKACQYTFTSRLGETLRLSPGPDHARLGRLPPGVLHAPANEGATSAAASPPGGHATAAAAERDDESGRAWIYVPERTAEGRRGHAEIMTVARLRGRGPRWHYVGCPGRLAEDRGKGVRGDSCR